MSLFVHALRCRSLAVLLAWLILAAAPDAIRLAAQELPPAIQADRLLLQAEQQIQAEAYGEALATLNRILDLQTEYGLQVPEAFWFNHAHVAMQAGLPDEARVSVVQYLQLAGQGGEHYRAALELLNEAEALEIQAETAAPGRVFRDCPRCPVMVRVLPGSFMMGSPATDAGRYDDEGPRRRVTIEYPLGVGVYEVTFAEWEACMLAAGCGGYRPDDEGWGRGQRPVINVSWEDAQAYVSWLSSETGYEYRLLSEAEWEYVARGGTTTARHWGESADTQCQYANGSNDSAPCSDGYAETAPAGSYQPNLFGLFDVLGNVWELTEDCWNGSYAGAPTDGRPWRSGNCGRRVLRGGSWYDHPDLLRSANRYGLSTGARDSLLGFRLARTLN